MRAGFKFLILVSVISVFACTGSCTKTPLACFTFSPTQDTIHLRDSVTFNATCSENAHQYYWQFYNNVDSIGYGVIVGRKFLDTGSINVTLLVTNGNNSNTASQYIYVLP
jgi:PKD repeat protein